MEPLPPLPLESLRRLARGLLYDKDRAEDVVQDAWLAALRKNPEAAALPAWMRTAVRHLALNVRREDERRARREQHVARPSESPETSEVLAHVETLRRVLDTLATLDEPYRTAVGLRYLEDLPPRTIAQKLGLPVNTVRTHVRRGLEELRRRLELRTKREDLLAALAPLAGRMPVGLVLGPSVLVGAAALAAAGLAGVLWLALRAPRVEPSAVAGGTTSVALASPSELASESAGSSREPVGSSSAVESAWNVRGRVSRGLAGRAVHAPLRARLFIGYRSDAPLALEETLTTDEHGEFVWSVEPPTTSVRLEVECLLPDHSSTPAGALVPRGEFPPELFLRAYPHDAALVGTLRAPDGAPVARGLVVLGKVRTTSASDGRFRLAVASENEELELWACSPGVGALRSTLAPFRPGEARPLDVTLLAEMVVRGTIRDEAGNPLEGVKVGSLFHELLDQESSFARSSADGRYELRLDSTMRWVNLQVSLPGRVPAQLETALRDPAGGAFEMANQDPDQVDFVLPFGRTVQGRVTDEQGAALEGASVFVSRHGRTHLTETGADGRFELEHVGEDLAVLSAYRPGYEQTKGREVSGEVLFELERLSFATGRVLDTKGAPLADVEVYGRTPTWTDRNGAFEAPVTARSKSLTLRAPGKAKARHELAAGRDELEIVLPDLGVFEGRVIDAATGEPVPAFTLTLFDPNNPGDRPDELPSEWRDGVACASADGRWWLAAEFAPGLSMAMLVQADGYVPAYLQDITSQPWSASEERIVRLYRSTLVRGHVSIAGGAAYPLARVERCTAQGQRLFEFMKKTALLGEAGNFELEGTPSGDGYLCVSLRGTSIIDGPFLVEGRPVERLIEVPDQASISGRLLDSSGQALVGLTVKLVTRDARGGTNGVGTWTDAEGVFAMNGLAAGEHVLGVELWAAPYSPPSESYLPNDQREVGRGLSRVTVLDLVEPVTLVTGHRLEIVLQVRGTTHLRGSLALAGGLPDIVAVTLTRLDDEGRATARKRGTLADRGLFEVRGLEAGSYDVEAEFERDDGTTCLGRARLVVAAQDAEASVHVELSAH